LWLASDRFTVGCSHTAFISQRTTMARKHWVHIQNLPHQTTLSFPDPQKKTTVMLSSFKHCIYVKKCMSAFIMHGILATLHWQIPSSWQMTAKDLAKRLTVKDSDDSLIWRKTVEFSMRVRKRVLDKPAIPSRPRLMKILLIREISNGRI
jgi:hypothetical protein